MLCQVLRLGCTSLLGPSRPSSSILVGYPSGHMASRFLSLQKSPAGASGDSSSMDGKEKQGLQNQQPEKLGDIMADSFGEAYATRSEEEGFGGIYGESQAFVRAERITVSKVVREGQPDYDDTQGSTVKEKEKGTPKKKILLHRCIHMLLTLFHAFVDVSSYDQFVTTFYVHTRVENEAV